MKISFDLDDTLIPSNQSVFPTENRRVFQKLLGVELLRKGTPKLFSELQNKGHTIGIYTTSFRSKQKISIQLRTYGINPSFIITEKENRKTLNSQSIFSSKYPPAFNIDLHIDDLPGVKLEGEKYGFNTIIIDKNDNEWDEKIKTFVNNK